MFWYREQGRTLETKEKQSQTINESETMSYSKNLLRSKFRSKNVVVCFVIWNQESCEIVQSVTENIPVHNRNCGGKNNNDLTQTHYFPM